MNSSSIRTLITTLLVLGSGQAALAQSAEAVYQKVEASVVTVRVADRSGSGVSFAPGRIATNCHVVRGHGQATISRPGIELVGEVTVCDDDLDIAILTIAANLPTPKIRAANTLKVGERVYAIGSPSGLDLSLSDGIVAQLRPARNHAVLIQTTAPISKGSSGGGLFDATGRLIGITTMYMRNAQNLNFAVAADAIPSARHRAPSASEKGHRAEGDQEPQQRCGWREITRDIDGNREYFDPCTLRRSGERVIVWTMADFATPKQDEVDNKGLYASSTARRILDCGLERSAVVGGALYAGSMATGKMLSSYSIPDNRWKYRDANPGSIGHRMVTTICAAIR